jgi:hypothetical protein
MGASVKNFILYNVGWFACVYFAAIGQAWVGVVAVAFVAAAHLLTVPAWRKEALTLLLAAIIGFCWESVLVWNGVLAYPTSPEGASFAPAWIVALWINFATTINVSLAWVKKRWWIASVFGAVGGPLAFAAGAGMGAVRFGDPVVTPLVIGAGWAVLLPLFSLLAESIIDSTFLEPGYRRQRRPSLLEQAQMLLTGKGLDK